MVTIVGDFKVDQDAEIGRGRFGSVFKAWNKEGKTAAAKKVIFKQNFNLSSDGFGDMDVATNELENAVKQQIKCNHDHIVKIFDVTSSPNHVWIFLEFAELGDLNMYVRGHYNEIQRPGACNNLIWQMTDGLKYLHDSNIVHRDIKPVNILVMKSNDPNRVVLKWTDFGIAKFLESDKTTMTTNVGTLPFKAPEFWKKNPDGTLAYHRSVDIFSLGLTFLSLIQATPGYDLMPSIEHSESALPIGVQLYTKEDDIDVIGDAKDDDYKTKKLKALIRKMTRFNPNERPRIGQVYSAVKKVSKTTMLGTQ